MPPPAPAPLPLPESVWVLFDPEGRPRTVGYDCRAAWEQSTAHTLAMLRGECLADFKARGWRCVECRLVPVPDPPEAPP